MKYANLKFSARSINNLGDNIQIIALDYIYELMGVSKNDIVYIDYHELSTYKEEYVVLPIAFPMIDYVENGVSGRFSDHIIPVFISFVLQRDFLYPAEIDYLKKFEPIGCRDEITNNILRSYNIKSYVHGCITFLLPERNNLIHTDKVFIVDAEEELVNLLPKKILENKDIEFRTHILKDNDPKEKALFQYNEYKDNASLIITSLLHCALPCFAAGIPIIMLNEKVACRKAFLEALFPIYNHNTIDSAMPSCLSEDLKIRKNCIIDLTIRRIKNTYNEDKEIFDTSYFFENRSNKSIYENEMFTPFKKYIDEKWDDLNGDYNYSVFGLNNCSEMLVNYIEKKYPNAKLIAAYDNFKDCIFFNHKNEKIGNIINNSENFVFVTAYGAIESVKFFEEKNYNRDLTFVKIGKEHVEVRRINKE